ncbi:unnamed protein product [Cyclocybe aegerita]|uniref:Uncharacterized protein n=1 Tax=Cyclocybe aegerita TaxID=1973307 RepID=A0A8S0W5Y7_CYCAE|nr:unnamed protein product [Cyclocybe aegerita]
MNFSDDYSRLHKLPCTSCPCPLPFSPMPMHTASQTPSRSPAEPSSIQGQPQLHTGSKSRQSGAIQTGADAILALVNQEREKVTALYHENIKALEAHFQDFRTKSEAEISSLNCRQNLHAKKAEALEGALANTHRVLTASQEQLKRARKENDAIKAALRDSGMEFTGAGLRFTGDTARVVEDFVQGARLQDKALALLGSDAKPLLQDDGSTVAVEAAEFFRILAGVLEKRWQFPEDATRNGAVPGPPTTCLGVKEAAERTERLVSEIISTIDIPPRACPPSPITSKTSASTGPPISTSPPMWRVVKRPAPTSLPQPPPPKHQRTTYST